MDVAYKNWIWILLIGAVLGMFIRPRTVVWLTVILEGIAMTGLVVSAGMSLDLPTWVFGLTAMALPVLGAVAATGALLASTIRGALATKKGPEGPS